MSSCIHCQLPSDRRWPVNEETGQVRSGKAKSGQVWGTYTGAARRRVHLATVLPRPPSSHRPGRRQARHAHILRIDLRLVISQADARPVMPVSLRSKNQIVLSTDYLVCGTL